MIICRCEEVSVEQLERAWASGLRSGRQVKMRTRATMGACQGRVCRALVEAWLGSQAPDEPESEQMPARFPVRPATFGQLAGEE